MQNLWYHELHKLEDAFLFNFLMKSEIQVADQAD